MRSGLHSRSDADSQAVAAGPVRAYLESLGPGSRRTMETALRRLARMLGGGASPDAFPWHALRDETTVALREKLAAELAPASANKHLAALRGVLRACLEQGSITAGDHARAIALPIVRGGAPPRPRLPDGAELIALAAACRADRSPTGARDAALLALLFGAGLRRAEVVRVDLGDYIRPAGMLLRRADGQCTKPVGGACRFAREDRLALERWLLLRGDAPGPLLTPVHRGGGIALRRLSEQAVYAACRRRAREAGLPPITPEDLRRAQSAVSRPQQPMRRVRPAADGSRVRRDATSA